METRSTTSDYWACKTTVPASLQAIFSSLKLDSALDLGCGGGRLAAFLSRLGKSYGIDASHDLISHVKRAYPEVTAVCGDFQLLESWRALDARFDLIASNCAIRKDYCPDFARVGQLCEQHLKQGGSLALRIQSVNDLCCLPKALREELFFDEDEIIKALPMFRLSITKEVYNQKFSSSWYVKGFLSRIQIPYEGVVRTVLPRSYYIVQGVAR